jgi:hypothetical protein
MALLDHALGFAELGWPVFPLAVRGKLPKIPAAHKDGGLCRGECGRDGHGLYDATIDQSKLRVWWRAYPNANIGLRTGIAFDVVDVDGRDGLEHLNRLCDAAGGEETIDGPTVKTAHGWHVYVAVRGLGNRTGVVPHVDYRGNGGYVVAPGSVHPGGCRYDWYVWDSSEAIKPAPEWFQRILHERPTPSRLDRLQGVERDRPGTTPYGRGALERECGKVALAVEGERNDTLNRAAFRIGQLIAGGEVHKVDAINALVTAAERTGLGGREIEATIAGGLRRGMLAPRAAA